MKKWLLSLCIILSTQTAFAADTVNIKIKISGATKDNRYFLCLRDVGCLSILAAQRGKVFPILRPIEMSGIFVEEVTREIHLSPQGLPASCSGKVDVNHTITITGQLNVKGNKAHVNRLNCVMS